jgi:predicted AlkP superfamily phosphohydrolase/phosphomutase
MKLTRAEFLKTLAIAGAVTASGSLLPSLSGCAPSFKPANGKVVILGFDGVDPRLVDKFIGQGRLPNLEKLASSGHYSPLTTTNPSESPVCWSAFATGSNPGKTGIYDFLSRDPQTYMPAYSITDKEKPKFLFGVIPYKKVKIINRRAGTTFWRTAAQNHIKSTAFQMPVCFPADQMEGGKCMSGLGVPDLRATQGTYQYFATDLTPQEVGSTEMGGVLRKILVVEGKVRTHAEGIPDPREEGFHPMRKPLNFTVDGDSVVIELDGEIQRVAAGSWSDWFTITFDIGPLVHIRGIAKFFVRGIKPELQIYLSPIDFHPADDIMPIFNPPSLGKELTKAVGLFRTRGWAIDNMALTEGAIDEQTFMDNLWMVENARRDMTLYLLDNDPADLFISVFQATDRVQHSFFRFLDQKHPRYDPALAEKFGDAIVSVYQHMDDVVGEVQKRITDDSTLIIMSDHGFHSFRRVVNLNTWLCKNGYMALKGSGEEGKLMNLDDLFGQGQFWPNVDWEKTQAYALGLGQIYVNKIGRERFGTVMSGPEYDQLLEKIVKELSALTDNDGNAAILGVYKGKDIWHGGEMDRAPDLQVGFNDGYRVSWQTCLGGIPKEVIEDNTKTWSGDHCSLEPSITKGTIFCNRKLGGEPSIMDLAPTALKILGVEIPEGYDGVSLV